MSAGASSKRPGEPPPAAGANLRWHAGLVTPEDRRRLLGQTGCVIWLTGLSGSGKSTLACAVERALVDAGHAAYVLDGDNVRHGLNANLGFSAEDRVENIRRVAHVARLFADAGVILLTAFISPFRSGRDAARAIVGPDRFVEVYLDVPVSVCEGRDPKGLYRKARAGEIADFTGVTSPFEPPLAPELALDTARLDLSLCVSGVVTFLAGRDLLGTVSP
jgi:adenylylsulfate kinase